MMPNNFSCHPSVPAWAPGPVCSTSCKTLNFVREINYQHQLRQQNTKIEVMSPHNCSQKGDSCTFECIEWIHRIQSYCINYPTNLASSDCIKRSIKEGVVLGKLDKVDPSQQPGALGSWVLFSVRPRQNPPSKTGDTKKDDMNQITAQKGIMNGKYLLLVIIILKYFEISFCLLSASMFHWLITIAWMGWMGFSWFLVAPCGGSEIRHSSPSMYKFIGKGWDKLPTISGLQDFWTINSVMEWSSESFV